jgi:EmrB/QacA subfamily drug resistance transporter
MEVREPETIGAATAERVVDQPTERPHVLLSRRRRQVVTAGILLGMFLAALEVTVVGTAMPTVIASLGGLNRYSWVFSAYLLTSTVSGPVWGRLSDQYGRRVLYLVGVVLFLLGSALSGMSQSITQLIVFRALQGLGAGGLIPLSLTINGDIYTMRERARIQGLFSGVWGLASMLGPLVGGFVTDQLSWRWVFYINIPFGIAAAIVVGLALVEPKLESRPVVDFAGAAWLSVGITLLLFVLVESGSEGAWRNPLILGSLAGIPLCAALFVRAERRAPEPIVPFSLFRNRVVTAGSISGVFVGMAMFGAISFIPLFIQGVLGGTATMAGTMLTPLLLAWVSMAVVGGRLMLRVGYKPTVLAGLTVLAVGFVVLSAVGITTPRWVLLADMALMGSGMGLVVLALLITTQASVERRQLGIATSLNLFSRSIGGTIGVAVMGTILTLGLVSHLKEITDKSGLPEGQVHQIVHNPSALIEPISRSQLPPLLIASMESALADALHLVFVGGAVIAGLALLSGFLLPAKFERPPPGSDSLDDPDRNRFTSGNEQR